MVLVCKIRFARYDVGYGAGLTQVSGTANISIDVIQKIVDNLEVHIKYTRKNLAAFFRYSLKRYKMFFKKNPKQLLTK